MLKSTVISILALLSCLSMAAYDDFTSTKPISDSSFSVSVNGKTIPVYQAKAEFEGGIYYFASFTQTGKSKIEITSDRSFENVNILPKSANIEAKVKRNKLTFKHSGMFKIAVECEGRIRPLLLFANPERNNPAQNSVKYYGPGVHHEKAIILKDNETLYVDEGAVLNAGISIAGDNVTICGTGVIAGDDFKRWEGPTGCMVEAKKCKNLTVRDVTITNSWSWTLVLRNCDGVDIDNVKICCANMINDDAVDICNSKNVTVRNCFLRAQDDIIAIKGMDASGLPCENILVENCQMWSDNANVWRIGYECDAPYFKNIISRNIDVLHYSREYRVPEEYWTNTIVFLQASNGITMSDIHFENVDVNVDDRNIVGLAIKSCLTAGPSVNPGKYTRGGIISDISFNNFNFIGNNENFDGWIWIEGYSPEDCVKSISLNMNYFGEKLLKESNRVKVYNYVDGIKF